MCVFKTDSDELLSAQHTWTDGGWFSTMAPETFGTDPQGTAPAPWEKPVPVGWRKEEANRAEV